MGGGPGYPGGTPALADGGATVLFCARDRGCTHLYAVPADGSAAPRPVLAEAGHVVSGFSLSAGKAAVALATPDSYGEIVVVDLASGERTTVTGHGLPACRQHVPAARAPTAARAAAVTAGRALPA